jgi:hypothetical protein
MPLRRAISFALVSTALMTTMVRAQPQAPNGGGACFFSRNFQQWRAPDANTILIRVGVNRFYRLDLAAPCHTLQFPNSHLVTVFRGSDTVCSPLDWDLRVAQYPAGITEQCIVRSMTQLTPEEVASFPPRFRP